MEKYGVNQSWEGCNRMVQYRASFRYVDYTANDKVIRRDSQTMQYTEYLYLPSNQGADSTCLAGVSAWCQSSSGIAWSPPILSIATTFSPVNQASQVRMIQQRGEMYAGRAQYAVTREQPGIIQRFSTTLATYATDQVSAAWQSTANDVSFYATSSDTGWNRLAGGRGAAVGLSEGDFTTALAAGNANQVCGAAGGAWALLQRFYYSEEPILLRYHLLSPQPGAVKGPTCAPGVLPCPTTTVPATFATRQTPISPAGGGANWVYTGGLWRPSATMYMGVLNMRNRRVTHRIPLEDCGNASVNVTAYEDCDIEHTAGAGLYEYDAGAGSGAYTQLTPGGRGISDYDYALGRAPAPAFWQRATRTYYRATKSASSSSSQRAQTAVRATGRTMRTCGLRAMPPVWALSLVYCARPAMRVPTGARPRGAAPCTPSSGATTPRRARQAAPGGRRQPGRWRGGVRGRQRDAPPPTRARRRPPRAPRWTSMRVEPSRGRPWTRPRPARPSRRRLVVAPRVPTTGPRAPAAARPQGPAPQSPPDGSAPSGATAATSSVVTAS